LALEGAFMLSAGQLLLASAFVSVGWLLRKRRKAALASADMRRWLRFWAGALPVFVGVYVFGYFILMDRHNPTSPVGGQAKFDSSLRWAPNERVTKATQPYETQWRSSTTWNILYRPMDRVWFRYFPQPRWGWSSFGSFPRVARKLATLGFGTESRWDSGGEFPKGINIRPTPIKPGVSKRESWSNSLDNKDRRR
jgi:hypothetical protein